MLTLLALFVIGMAPEVVFIARDATGALISYFWRGSRLTLLERDRQSMEIVKIVVSIVALFFSGVAIVVSARVATKLKNQDIVNDRRRLFITGLWDKLTAVRGLESGNATRDRVIEVLNTLELVALCWESNIVDKDLIARAFGDSYSLRVNEVNGITSGKGYDALITELGMDGPGLLKQYDRIVPVCNEIKKQLSTRVKRGDQP